jgi:hypothetical protein
MVSMKRKTKLLTTLFLISLALNSEAQSVELTPFAGYTFRSTINITGGQARVHDGFTYGGALTVAASKFNALELSYYRYGTTATAESSYTGFVEVSTPVAVNYMFIGGQRLFPTSDKVTGFSGINLGAGWISSTDNAFSSITKFAMGFDLGVKIMASEKIGIRLQTNLNFPISSSGGTMWWSSGNTNVGMTGNVPIWSFGFMGGLIYKIK